jgi:hypothetical protein
MSKTSKTAGVVQDKAVHFNVEGLLLKLTLSRVKSCSMFNPSVSPFPMLQFLGDQIGSSSQVSTLNTFSSASLNERKKLLQLHIPWQPAS